MKFNLDESMGWLIEKSPDNKGELESIIWDMYSTDRKELGEKKFYEKVKETAKSILDGEYQAHLDIFGKDTDVLVIEPVYGLGSVEIAIDGIIV